MESYDKPFRTYDEQIAYLREIHGLDISNEKFAKSILRSISYYDLINGYKDAFMNEERYVKHISIEYLYAFYRFDRKFQDLLFSQILIIESSFKTELAYIIAKDFGIDFDAYMDENNFLPKHKKLTYNTIRRNIKDEAFSRPMNPTKHYKEHHNHVPPWILFKNVTFSTTINLFQIMKPEQKSYIVNSMIPSNGLSYKEKVDLLVNGLNLVRKCRNSIAHGLKFLTFHEERNRLSPNPLTKLLPNCLLTWKDIKQSKRGLNDIHAVLGLSLVLISVYNPKISKNFCKEMVRLLSPQDDSNEEVIKKALFSDYAATSNLPVDLANRLNAYADCIL